MFVRLIMITLIALIAWAAFVRASEGAGPERTYIVQPTDTLWSIATSHYGGDPREGVWRLRERNGLDGTLLHPGDRLVLPRG